MRERGKNGGFYCHLFLPTLLLLLLEFFLVFAAAGGHRGGAHSNRHDGAHRHQEILIRRMERMMATAAAGSPAPSPSPQPGSMSTRVYHVKDYGADPTGNADSSAAIARAISDAFVAPSNRQLIQGITDLGGAEIDLDGGAYLISTPISLPPKGGGNLKIHSGSLRASADFPTGRYVVELWVDPSSAYGAKSVNTSVLLSTSGYDYEYVTLRGVMVDANYLAGGIAVVNALRTTIDNCYVVHFASDGIWVKGGHETLIRGVYLGQHVTAGADPREKDFSGIGINLMGNDNAVTDTVIFSAATGILVSGQANVLTGVHCYNKATAFGGTGIYLKLPGNTQTRIVNCYMDYTGIVAEDPVQLIVSGTFFLGDGNIVFKSVNGVMKDVNVVNNMFSGSGKGVPIVRLDGSFASVDAVVVERNGAEGMAVRSTTAKGAVKGEATTVWAVDFAPVLLFPDRIDHVQYALHPESGFPSHALRNVSANRVVVETNVPVKATVHVTVDQSGRSN